MPLDTTTSEFEHFHFQVLLSCPDYDIYTGSKISGCPRQEHELRAFSLYLSTTALALREKKTNGASNFTAKNPNE